MKIICTTQRTEEWYAARRGRITASEMGNVCAKPGGKGREAYLLRLALDIEGVPDINDHDIAPWFVDGIKHESWVCGWYEWERNVTVAHTGLLVHDEHDWLGCSPDGLVGGDGLVEFKYRTSVMAYRNAVQSIRPHKQIQMQLLVTGRRWCDEVNYHRQFNSDGTMKLEHGFIRRHHADRAVQSWLEERAMTFRADVLRLVQARALRA